MTWGCKQKPNGCGWATRLDYPRGTQEWWCDTCERSGHISSLQAAARAASDLAASAPDHAADVAGTTNGDCRG